MRTRLTLSLAAVALAALPGCAGGTAPNDAAVAVQTDAQPSEQDRSWLRDSHGGNLAEIQAGRMAMRKGTTDQIKSLGEMLLNDHTKLGHKVTRTAEQLGIQLPTSPNADQRAVVRRLRESSGKEFDQDFLSGMVKAHTEAVAATKAEISGGSAPATKELAKTALPALEGHLSAIRKAQGD
ncbi:DUF4142 domain-containing protein [Nonomuraea sp. NPDC050404]|uniref:DUF4142 domain-containing protein n=1 Tax=Nonomuraea sp. NPDC050404 TaxID=3155783 RepID=UPI0033D5DF97